jgi:hypothetical protein
MHGASTKLDCFPIKPVAAAQMKAILAGFEAIAAPDCVRRQSPV